MVGHQRTRLQRVDVAEHEIAEVLDPGLAQIAPEVRIAFDVAAILADVVESRQQVVERPAPAGQPGVGPIDRRLPRPYDSRPSRDRGRRARRTCRAPRESRRGEARARWRCGSRSRSPWPADRAATAGSRDRRRLARRSCRGWDRPPRPTPISSCESRNRPGNAYTPFTFSSVAQSVSSNTVKANRLPSGQTSALSLIVGLMAYCLA